MNCQENDSSEGVPREESAHDFCLMFLLVHSLIYVYLPIYQYICIDEEDVGFIFPLKGVTMTRKPSPAMYLTAEVLLRICVICCGVKTGSTPLCVLSAAFAESWCMSIGVKQWDSAHISLGWFSCPHEVVYFHSRHLRGLPGQTWIPVHSPLMKYLFCSGDPQGQGIWCFLISGSDPTSLGLHWLSFHKALSVVSWPIDIVCTALLSLMMMFKVS